MCRRRAVGERRPSLRWRTILKKWAKEDGNIVWLDLTEKLTDATGWVPKEIMPDELHPADKGYEIWAEALKPYLREAGVQSQDGNK